MTRPPTIIDQQLEASLRRIGDALARSRGQYVAMAEQIAAARTIDVAERLAERAAEIEARTAGAAGRLAERAAEIEARIIEKRQRQIERRLRRAERRRAFRERETAGALPRGIVLAIVAVACLGVALRQPEMFWMVFVALGLGMSSVASFARAARGQRASSDADPEQESEPSSETTPGTARPAETVTPEPPPAAEPADPKVVRIQGLCDTILAELESGPPIVREVVTQPQATIGGLRQACVETARRERELRNVLAAQDEAVLLAERDSLAARVAAERDAIAHDRLGQALRALEQKLANRAELVTAATRLEAENTRILYTLENLHMQLLRARSTDAGAPELGGKLRDSLRDLGTQIDAVAEALEWASAPPASGEPASAPPVVRGEATSDTLAARSDAQRADREAAARRAQAREAQRQ
jgi:hypothetical protein